MACWFCQDKTTSTKDRKVWTLKRFSFNCLKWCNKYQILTKNPNGSSLKDLARLILTETSLNEEPEVGHLDFDANTPSLGDKFLIISVQKKNCKCIRSDIASLLIKVGIHLIILMRSLHQGKSRFKLKSM